MKGWARVIALGLWLVPVSGAGAIVIEPLLAQRSEETGARDQQRAWEFNQQATQLYRVSRWQEAVERWKEALSIFRSVGDRAAEGEMLNNIGVVYYSQGQYQLALEQYQQALAIRREVGDRAGEGMTLNNIGYVYYRQGQYGLALEQYQQALAIHREVGDRPSEGTTLNDIGYVYHRQRQHGLALEQYQKALTIHREVGDRAGEGETLNNIGGVYNSQGQYSLALEHYQKALALRREVGSRAGEGTTLNNIGYVYYRQGQYGLALEQYQRALVIFREVGDRPSEGTTINNIGAVYDSQGQYRLALEHYQKALAMRREVGDRAGEGMTLNNIGEVYRSQGQYKLALEQYQQALAILREVGDHPSAGITINNIGEVYRSQGQYKLALEQYQQALVILREVSNRAGEGTTLNNIGLVYQRQGQYELALGQYQQALTILREVGDRAMEGTTLNNIGLTYLQLNQLDRSESFFRQSLVVEEAIGRDVGTSDHDRISFFETRSLTYSLLSQLLVQQQKYNEALEIADRGRARSLAEFLSPSTADRPRSPLSAQQMQQMARDRNATLLVYAIVDQEIYSWAVTPAGEIAFAQVDPTTVGIPITAVADRTRQSANVPSNDLVFAHDKYRLDLQANRSDGEDGLFTGDPESLKRIYRLLIQPIASHLPSNPGARLIIVPHRELSTVPFAALLDERDRFLVERYAISVTPSLQVLAATGDRTNNPSAPPLVVGNPSPMPAKTNGQPLTPLPGAETEAQAIATLLNTTPLLNRQATETTVKQRLTSARILHLATHGILSEDARGIQDSWLAFGPSSSDDGKLSLSEIFDSQLSAELAVLSACDTNRGQVTGEGVLGLARAFLKAGTPTVVASLWKVPDQQTAMLMEAFYQELLAGRDRAAALQAAQLKVRAQYPNPRYWAAFVLIGEGDRPLSR